MEDFRRYNQWVIVWEVRDHDDECIACFKNPWNAANYAIRRGFLNVDMALHMPEWHTETLD